MISHLQHTNVSAISKELSSLLASNGSLSSSRVLTLVVLAEKGHSREAINAAIRASREHPSRIIVHIAHNSDAPDQLDAEIHVGGEAGASELIILRGWGSASTPTESLISGLLLPDSPIVVWWPHSVPENPGEDSIGRIAQRRITDSARAYDPMAVLTHLSKVYQAGDSDLAWTRLTLWRTQLAALLEQMPDSPVKRVVVWGSEKSPSVVLLGAWLGWKLEAEVHLATIGAAERGLYRVAIEREDGQTIMFRPGKNIAIIETPYTPDQQIPLPVRTLADCISEELRRLDPDTMYGEVLKSAFPTLEMHSAQCDAEPFLNTSEFPEVFDA